MPLDRDKLARAETGEAGFSRLEATLVTNPEVVPRPNSRQMNDVSRHTDAADLQFQNELEFDYSLDTRDYPLGNLQSLQQVFDAVQCHKHLGKHKNFSDQTKIECLEVTHAGAEWKTLDDYDLKDLIKEPGQASNAFPLPLLADETRNTPKGRLLLFLVPLTPTTDTSFGSRIQMSQSSTRELYETLKIHPIFLLNMLGRPDYWAPVNHWDTGQGDKLQAFDFSCQHPRWNLQVQGAPLSVYMRHDVSKNETIYIISHKQKDTNVQALRNILNVALRTSSEQLRATIFLDDPFDMHVILSTLSFETSKHHVKRFQRFMWTQINKVDDQLAGLQNRDRAQLSELTKQLQVISQNADSHLGNADVCIITATRICQAHARVYPGRIEPFRHQHVKDSIDYVIESMKKQKIWFLNYKNRKDSTMSLVYNLVTQQDAANNIELAADMKRDSTSMSAIAALTMVFLPGTFTAAVIDAGIFFSPSGTQVIKVNGIWWFWLAITLPLTLIIMACWWLYKRRKDAPKPVSLQADGERRKSGPGRPNTRRFSSFGSFMLPSRYGMGRLTSQGGKLD
ncbi:hypothetical protein A1O1_02306 [Capronia coronata CBS 617.96]|uniref:Uncharacterized protein n=1 Tax=Capronia coronata CBS 617.96 TaxID=1182541 RepID=W9YN09_9EURO|nr:uncharacterized protein A1O1_02306 [Capronia coronata CBS 617.96]EXJ93913.1 hypothetical protein A1O1_02306 [Capronia coronata CBS 617.96]